MNLPHIPSAVCANLRFAGGDEDGGGGDGGRELEEPRVRQRLADQQERIAQGARHGGRAVQVTSQTLCVHLQSRERDAVKDGPHRRSMTDVRVKGQGCAADCDVRVADDSAGT